MYKRGNAGARDPVPVPAEGLRRVLTLDTVPRRVYGRRMAFTTSTNYLTAGQYRSAKSRLTKAVRSGNHQRVLDVVQETFDEWDDGDYAYPDDWHRWERARLDAEMALRWAS